MTINNEPIGLWDAFNGTEWGEVQGLGTVTDVNEETGIVTVQLGNFSAPSPAEDKEECPAESSPLHRASQRWGSAGLIPGGEDA